MSGLNSRSSNECSQSALHHKRHTATFLCRTYGEWESLNPKPSHSDLPAGTGSTKQRTVFTGVTWRQAQRDRLNIARFHDKSFWRSNTVYPMEPGGRQSNNLQKLFRFLMGTRQGPIRLSYWVRGVKTAARRLASSTWPRETSFLTRSRRVAASVCPCLAARISHLRASTLSAFTPTPRL